MLVFWALAENVDEPLDSVATGIQSGIVSHQDTITARTCCLNFIHEFTTGAPRHHLVETGVIIPHSYSGSQTFPVLIGSPDVFYSF